MLNELIPRIKADPHYRQTAGQNRAPDSENDSPYLSAKLKVPVLSLHTIGELPAYLERLRATGRERWAELLESRHGAR